MKKVNITLTSWEYNCADGCCTDYGTKLSVNGVEGESMYEGDNVHSALEFVLKELGYDPIITEKHE